MTEEQEEPLPGTLYLVSTPIGNLSDLSDRARKVLSRVDTILAEDTRVSRTLLQHIGVSNRPHALHDHNEREKVAGIVAELVRGKTIALISDAGTPLVSDPGYVLVRACIDADLQVRPIPGASAALCALLASGLPPDRFMVAGFLPHKAGARDEMLRGLAAVQASLVFFMSPHRIGGDLGAMREIFGADRPCSLSCDLTKRGERHVRGTLGALDLEEIGTHGEWTVVVGGAPPAAGPDEARIDRLAERLLLAGLPASEVRDLVMDALDAPRSLVYPRVLALKKD